ncbi:Hypothetical protein CINCED_3A011540 [Cinara cedri]|uniref:Exportin-4 n=1 Tax=Cinara cedri TaxID=506608 RepID=A0A5E4MY37_9HEMI|nr:Hypothetical protein CINCED_3A011540 [Cinara cedri]
MEEAQQLLQELEDAGKIILSGPQVVTDSQRSAAEMIFMRFRKTYMPYTICLYIFDHSKDNYVLFEVVGTLRDAILRDWTLLSKDQKTELRQYLFQFMMRERTTIELYVRKRILQVIAIMIKRGSVEDNGHERELILDEVEKLILNGEEEEQIIGCSFILALMQEYSTTVKSADVGLTWESHYSAKKAFEARDLKRIFIICTRAINEVQNNPQFSVSSSYVINVLEHLLNISESVLVWGFISTNMPRYLIGMFEGIYNSENSPTLKLGSEWKDIITNPSTIDIYFNIYWKVRDISHIAYYGLNCLVQLSSINGNIWADTNERMKYMQNYIEYFIKLVSTVRILDRESIGISTIVKRIISGFTPSSFNQFSHDLVDRFLENVTHLTCRFAEGATAEGNIHHDDQMFFEAFNNILRPWASIIVNSNQSIFQEDICKKSSFVIFDTYLKCHLSPPKGTKVSDSKFNELDEPDRIANKEQLQYLGIFGRQVPEHTLDLLVTLIESQIKELRSIIEHIHCSGSSNWSESVQKKIDDIHEDIHWMFLIAGHVITVDSEGEPSMIPSEIMHYSIRKSEKVNIEVSLKFLVHQMLVMDTPGSEEAVDDVIKLVSIAFNLCEVENRLIEAKMESLCSPLLSGTIVWFLHVFSQTYLMPNETYYSELSMPLLQAFGQHTEAASWVLNYLLNKVERNIRSPLFTDMDLINDTIGLLISLVEIRHKAEVVINCEGFWKLFQLQDQIPEVQIVPEAKEGLYKAFSLAADAFIEEDKQNEYWMREESEQFYTSCFQMVDMYARYNLNRVSLDSDAEEQCSEDLYIFLELLTHVMSKEVLDLSSDGRTPTGKTPGDVCVYGLQIILPLMTIDLLKFPTLCLQYYKNPFIEFHCIMQHLSILKFQKVQFAGYMCEMVPLKLCVKNVAIFKGVLASIELGLTTFGHDITSMCIDFLQSAASFMYRHDNSTSIEAYDLLKPFLKYLMELILSCQISSDALSSTGHALYTLICCYPNEFQQISMQLINNQTDELIAERLRCAFTLLTSNIDFNGQHSMKCRFKNNFDCFTTNIRGFLFVK